MALKVWLPLSNDYTTNYGLEDVRVYANGSDPQVTPVPVYANDILGKKGMAFGSAGTSMLLDIWAVMYTTAFSVSMWVKEVSAATNSTLFLIRGSNGNVECKKAADGYTLTGLVSGTAFTLESGWNHLAITADGTKVKVYVNGVMDELDQTGSITFDNETGFTLAGNYNGYNPNPTWSGIISNFKAYDSVISQFEAVADSNALVVNYSFNGIVELGTGVTLPAETTAADFGFGDNVHDLSGNGFDATYGTKKPVSSTDTGMYSACMDFTNADAVTSAVITANEFVNRNTISFWAKGLGTVASFGTGLNVYADNSEWQNIVIVTSGNTVTKYINGVATDDILDPIIPSGNINIAVGGAFTGKISDFRVYAKAMSAEEVLALYKRRAAVDNSGQVIASEFVVNDDVTAPGFSKAGVISSVDLANWTGKADSPVDVTRFAIYQATGAVNATDVIEY